MTASEAIYSADAIRVRYRRPGYGWYVVGPGVVEGVRQVVNLAGPFTSAEAAVERAEELRAELAAPIAPESIRAELDQCRSTSPTYGVRCAKPAGHAGEHESVDRVYWSDRFAGARVRAS